MARRKRIVNGKWDGTYEVVTPTPAGAQWMPESQARNVPKPDHWSADYNPMGRPADVPASYYRNLPIRKKEEPINFNQEMAAALGTLLKANAWQVVAADRAVGKSLTQKIHSQYSMVGQHLTFCQPCSLGRGDISNARTNKKEKNQKSIKTGR